MEGKGSIGSAWQCRGRDRTQGGPLCRNSSEQAARDTGRRGAQQGAGGVRGGTRARAREICFVDGFGFTG